MNKYECISFTERMRSIQFKPILQDAIEIFMIMRHALDLEDIQVACQMGIPQFDAASITYH